MARKVLIVKLAAIGDVVMALPMVTALRAINPNARISWLCGHSAAPLLDIVDGIDEVIPVNEAAMLAGSFWAQCVAVWSAWRKVGGRKFDTVYVAHSDARYRVLGWPIRSGNQRWLAADRKRGLLPGRSHTDEYVRLVTGVDDHRARSYAFPRVSATLPPSLVRRLETHNPENRPLVTLTPGGARNVARENPLRRWPLKRYVELARELRSRGYAVAITGGRTDGWVRAEFRGEDVVDFIGATHLPALAALLHHSAAVVAHDSGPLHIARLVGTPVVALLGPTPPTMFFRPQPRIAALWPAATLPCAPCYDGTNFALCHDNVCMKLIDCAAVVAQVEALLSNTRSADLERNSTR